MNWLFGGIGYLIGRGVGAAPLGGCAAFIINAFCLMLVGVCLVAGIKGCEQEKKIESDEVEAGYAIRQMLTVTALPEWQRSNPNIKSITMAKVRYDAGYNESMYGASSVVLADGRVLSYSAAEWDTMGFGGFTIKYNDGTTDDGVYISIITRTGSVPGTDELAGRWRKNHNHVSLLDGYYALRRDSKVIATIDRLGDVSADVAEAQQEKDAERKELAEKEADFRRIVGEDYYNNHYNNR